MESALAYAFIRIIVGVGPRFFAALRMTVVS